MLPRSQPLNPQLLPRKVCFPPRGQMHTHCPPRERAHCPRHPLQKMSRKMSALAFRWEQKTKKEGGRVCSNDSALEYPYSGGRYFFMQWRRALYKKNKRPVSATENGIHRYGDLVCVLVTYRPISSLRIPPPKLHAARRPPQQSLLPSFPFLLGQDRICEPINLSFAGLCGRRRRCSCLLRTYTTQMHVGGGGGASTHIHKLSYSPINFERSLSHPPPYVPIPTRFPDSQPSFTPLRGSPEGREEMQIATEKGPQREREDTEQ